MKKLDKLLITSFIPPFFVMFLIALFVLIMQFLWVYIDEIVGKGGSIFMVVEFLFYLSISFVPWALPLGILIASVMVMGNFAERYELASMKSAGISLLRVIQPLFLTCLVIASFSYVCSNYINPVANLKFKSRLYDFRKQKPALSLEQGMFNDDFQGYVIRIGSKRTDGKTIGDVLIYNHAMEDQTRINETLAESGEMFTTADKQFLVMNLHNGKQYQEPRPDYNATTRRKEQYPFVRISFREWSKIFDLREFDLTRTDESMFRNNQAMLSTSQLLQAVDSIDVRKAERRKEFALQRNTFITILDTSRLVRDSAAIPVMRQWRWDTIPRVAAVDSIFSGLPDFEKKQLYARAASNVNAIIEQAKGTITSVDRLYESELKHKFELHSKFIWAAVCLVFLFIGAPMGAIVRKGGFGYPILIAIIFFMLFITLTIMCKKLAESHTLTPELGAWMPCLVLMPVGVILTWKAMHDSTLFNIDAIETRVRNWFSKLQKRRERRLRREEPS